MKNRLINWFRFSSPVTFYPLASRILIWAKWIAIITIGVGLYLSFFVAPTDYKQGEG